MPEVLDQQVVPCDSAVWDGMGVGHWVPVSTAYSPGGSARGPADAVAMVIAHRGQGPRWLAALVQRLGDLAALPDNWDSYGARRLDARAIEATIRAVGEVVADGVPLPEIVPTSSGWVQLEWHRPGVDLEVRLRTPSLAEMFYANERSGEEREALLRGTFEPVAELLRREFRR